MNRTVDNRNHGMGATPWLLPLAVSLHNLEETLWLPGFWRGLGWNPLPPQAFRLAELGVAALAWAITYQAIGRGRKSLAARALVIFCLIMFLNALWHVAATIYMRRYAPGVVTAVLVVLPATAYLLLKARAGSWL
ncbi:MAG: HXXEE domain-containing protein [Acidobacteria bacterium]|nr:HXXEE domain-containing protein [Acidobacteriota bacterium]